jgi:hypothetical protein
MNRVAALALRRLPLSPTTLLGWAVAFLLAAGASMASSQQAQPTSTLTACKLFQDLLAYSGKMITVRGRLEITRHGWFLGPAEACPHRFIVGGKVWPNGLSIDLAGSSVVSPPVSFDLDKARVDRMDDLLSFLKGRTPQEAGVVIIATFTGELRTGRIVKEMLGPVPISEHYTGAFGHGGECPAQLVIKTVEEIVITQK